MTPLKITPEDKEKGKHIELRSDEIQEILGQIPRWIIRYGTLLILFIVCSLFLGSIVLKYPDIITARIKLTTETPPAEITANVSGRIQMVITEDKAMVDKGDILVIIESASDYHDVQLAIKSLGTNFNIDTILKAHLPKSLQLGSIQDSYAALIKQIQEYNDFISLNYYTRKALSVKAEFIRYRSYMTSLSNQEKVLEEEYELVSKQYSRDSLLFQQSVISSVQLEKSESQKLGKLLSWKETKTKLSSAKIEESNLQQEILELEMRKEEAEREYLNLLQEEYDKFKGQVAIWENQYLIRAPFGGQITFTHIWSENQYIEEGEIVVTVIPHDQGNIVGISTLAAKGAGKVRKGNKVLIQFDNYPYMEYGTVTGKLESLSLVPNNEQYIAEIMLDSSLLLTNYGIHLDFNQNMPGTAEIVTDERSLMSRIVSPFRAAISKQKSLGSK